ncbi:MAG: hypothetical protein IKT44_00695 [Clostridia bacterium]|nr:hypothetical protein [Clostridia bacterium]
MNTINKEATLNNEQEVNLGENNAAKTPSVKDRVLEDGKLTFWEILYVARYFLPILATIGWAIGLGCEPADGTFLMVFSLILVGIGLISAITVCPLKLLALPFKWAIRGFFILRSFIPVYGVADLCAAIFGTAGGFVLGVFVIFGLPAIFTITKFFNEDSFQ